MAYNLLVSRELWVVKCLFGFFSTKKPFHFGRVVFISIRCMANLADLVFLYFSVQGGQSDAEQTRSLCFIPFGVG